MRRRTIVQKKGGGVGEEGNKKEIARFLQSVIPSSFVEE